MVLPKNRGGFNLVLVGSDEEPPGDRVGVAAEPIEAGEIVEGVVLEDNSSVRARAIHDIPLGHNTREFVLMKLYRSA